MYAELDRRRFLKGSAALSGLGRVAGAQTSGGEKRLRVIVTGGHPGDPEYGCGGTIARYTDLGHQVVLFYLNRGEKGCPNKSMQACGELRSAEAQKACQILGASPRFFDQVDGEADVNAGAYDRFYALLQAERPDVVFTHWPVDNHRDHRATSNLVYDAWNRARRSFGLYFYEVSDGEDTLMFSPTDYVDISKTEPRKRSACFAHGSQTPDRYYALQTEVAKFRGTESGYVQAEAFIRQRESPGHLLP
jgi:LmbE family N-acetylglucosaminyl deacetylase